LVEKLNLDVVPHPKPYQLHWTNERGDIIVTNQVKVKLSVGNYTDQVLCDVVPWKLVMFYWVGHGNLIRKLYITVYPMKLPSLVIRKSLYFIL